ncbi:MAG: orotate phosphoribosyltransferase [Fusobacteriaceae bacterium]
MKDNIVVAQALLKTQAVRLNVKSPFTFVSGIKSPIYCDNRKMIGFPEERNIVVEAFINKIKELEKNGIHFDIIAGTSTAGIPWAAFIAMKLNKPMAYIRGEKKAHGAGKQIEGADFKGKKVLIIEDLISTGGSSIKAVKAALEGGSTYTQVLSIFSYEFKKACDLFSLDNIEWSSLSNFEILLEVAKTENYITEDELLIAKKWNKNPQTYGVEV